MYRINVSHVGERIQTLNYLSFFSEIIFLITTKKQSAIPKQIGIILFGIGNVT